MHQNDIKSSMRRFVLKILVIGGAIIIAANAMYMFMTWLVDNVFRIPDLYLRQETIFAGTCVLCLVILLILLNMNYLKRKRTLTLLSENIEKVASGDFSSQIVYNPHDSMANIYRDFNKMSSELSSVQFLKKDFINNYSHEFKTPLASINGFSSLMLERELPRDQQTEYLKIIRDESERLINLTSNTILLTKLSSQEYLSHIECFDLGEQLRQCSIILSHEWLKKDITFSGEFLKADYNGSRELLQHLWLNLIGNAVKYTPRGGEISVVMLQDEEKITVSVADTGEGMDEETLQHLFIPYYQGNSSSSRQGLGLGLAIAKQIVGICEGSIDVVSKPGEGSTFTVTLPNR